MEDPAPGDDGPETSNMEGGSDDDSSGDDDLTVFSACESIVPVPAKGRNARGKARARMADVATSSSSKNAAAAGAANPGLANAKSIAPGKVSERRLRIRIELTDSTPKP